MLNKHWGPADDLDSKLSDKSIWVVKGQDWFEVDADSVSGIFSGGSEIAPFVPEKVCVKEKDGETLLVVAPGHADAIPLISALHNMGVVRQVALS
jgi:hypothetical protein